MENNLAEMSPVARQANASKLCGRKPALKNSLESPLGRPNTPILLSCVIIISLMTGQSWYTSDARSGIGFKIGNNELRCCTKV